MNPLVQGVGGAAEPFGGGPPVEIAEHTQHDRFPVKFGKFRNRRFEPFHIGTVVFRNGRSGGIGGEFARFALPRPQNVVAGIDRDPVDPARHFRIAPEGIEFPPCRQQCQLNRLIRIRRVAGDPVRHAAQHRQMFIDQMIEYRFAIIH